MSDRPDIEAIKARAKEATPGPWFADAADSAFDETGRCVNDERDISSCVTSEWDIVAECIDKGADRVFVAISRTDVPNLCAHVERLEASNAALLAACKEAKVTIYESYPIDAERGRLLIMLDKAIKAAEPTA